MEITDEQLTAIIENSQVGIMFLKGSLLHKGNQRLADILGMRPPSPWWA